ncbi:MAG: lytic transglycosylase domain-containing protein [Proteobacteria bacterium]|nr:lytic transglycosylase domain-containing protein [Pseudomonadota bacterium]
MFRAGILAFFIGTSLYASSPLEKAFNFGKIEHCLKREVDEEGYELQCPLEEFITQAREENFKNPALRIVVADTLFDDVLKVKDEIFGKIQKKLKIPQADFQAPTLSQFLFGVPNQQQAPNSESSNMGPMGPQPGVNNPESDLIAKTERHLDEIEFWLKPMLEASPSPLFQFDAHMLKFQVLGETLRFSALESFLKNRSTYLLNDDKSSKKIFQLIAGWIQEQGAMPMREWLLEESKRRRKEPLKDNLSDDNFFYWTQSIALSGPPKDMVERHFLIERLNDLWVYFPDESFRKKVKDIVRVYKLNLFFNPPALKDLSLEQILAQVRYLVKKVQGQQALMVLNEIFNLPKDKVTDQEMLWEAFKLHVRVLRILDQREKIPDIIQRYLLVKRFLNLDKNSPSIAADVQKLLQIARWYWTYEREEEAKRIFLEVVKFNEDNNFSYGLEDALYYLARISEQGERKAESLPEIDKALASRQPDESRVSLLWRKFFIIWEVSIKDKKPNAADLTKALEALIPFARSDDEKIMFRFWRGRLAVYLNDKKAAKKYFQESYDLDPLSFYGTLSGLALIEMGTPLKSWRLRVAPEIKEPQWSDFFSDIGVPKSREYGSLAQAYFYYRIQQEDKARLLFPSLSASLWRFFDSNKRYPQKALSFAYAVSWLRFKMGDAMGSLQVSEMLRIKNAGKYREEELSYLYPLSNWDLIQKESEKNKISPWMTAGLIRQESAFNPRARSHANALGLMQMIPPVADKEAKKAKLASFEYDDLFKPEVSIKLGTQHLATLFQDFELSFIATFAAYNAGSPPVKKWLSFYRDSDPLMFIERISYQETRDYVKKLLRNFILYQRLYSDGKVEAAKIMKLPQQLKAPSLLVNETASRGSP